MGFTDGKDVSRTIRTGFTDTFLVSHITRELTERYFVMDKTLCKIHLPWLLLMYTLGNSKICIVHPTNLQNKIHQKR